MLLELKDLFAKDNQMIQMDQTVLFCQFETSFGSFRIIEKTPLHLELFHETKKRFTVKGTIDFVFEIPCDRCLEMVAYPLHLNIQKKFDLNGSEEIQDEESEEWYISDGESLNTEQLIKDELLINWPTKVLCRNDCKGICKICGHNLNVSDCGCDRVVLDPRMAAIQDIFKNNNK